MFIRRLFSLTLLYTLAIVFYAAAPVLILIALILSVAKPLRTLPHALLFALGFLFYECIGVIRLFWLWCRYRNSPEFLAHNQQVQYWWANGLLQLGIRIYDLQIAISGKEALEGSSALMIVRHTSIADTVLPMLYFAKVRNEGMRYILKKELTAMPCLDIAGHRLPNLFVDRSGTDTDKELNAIRQLTATAGPEESVLVYPEGTRFTPQKQATLMASKPELAEQLRRWPSLLPPRLGGVSAMLEANPGKDVVFLAHVGFEGSASLRDLVNGSWRRQPIHLHFWRVPFQRINPDTQAFVFENWDKMQQHIDAMTHA
ncbi:MAG: 1-acyl-sn-glycerol-3-phosphate acyltransferase [bacterium]